MNFNVLHIGDELNWRGAENQILQLSRGLKEFGVGSVIAYPQKSLAIPRFREEFPVIELCSQSTLDPRNIIQLTRAIKKFNIQIIDAHSSTGMNFGLLLKKLSPKIKLVVHRRVAFPIKDNFFSKRKYLSPSIDQYVAISDAIANVLLAGGVEKELITVVKSSYTPIDFSNFSSMDSKKWILDQIDKLAKTDKIYAAVSTTIPWIGFAGAMTKEKGCDVFLQSLAILKSKGIPFFAPIAGGGPLLEKYQSESQRLSLSNDVIFLGAIQNMPKFLSAIDIFVFPSTNEGLGTTLLDAIQAGCVVIGSRVGGIPEIIIDNKTGLLVDPNAPDQIAEAIEKIFESAERSVDMLHAAGDHILKHFSPEAMVQGNLDTYKRLIQARDQI